jgi:formate hydrogenlyase subunit 3/multisubunit Na+/H+ antiporter MnhD subunit
MDWPYLHTLVNHFPIILSVVGFAVLILALINNRRGVWLYAVATLTLAGLSAYPAFFTGDQASHALRGVWYIVRSAVHAHDESAGYALTTLLITGVVSAYAWWYMLRRDRDGLPPKWLRTTLVIVAAITLAVVTRTAYLGGKIVVDSPMLNHPPAGMVPDTSAHP